MFNINDIISKLSFHQPLMKGETIPSAGVLLILLIGDHEQIDVVLTKRSETLVAYAGHISLPGGMREENDDDLLATAIRETWEELAIKQEDYQLIGQLNDFEDRFDHLVRPFVAVMQKIDFEKKYKLSQAEVSSVFFLSLDKLKDIHEDASLNHLSKHPPIYSYTDRDYFLWGLTARILVHFLAIIQPTNELSDK